MHDIGHTGAGYADDEDLYGLLVTHPPESSHGVRPCTPAPQKTSGGSHCFPDLDPVLSLTIGEVMAKSRQGDSPSKKGSVVVRNAVSGRYLSKAAAAHHSRTTVKESGVIDMAARVTGDPRAAERWYGRPNDLLGGRTPQQAVKDGDKEKVVGLLLNVAGQ